MLFCIIYEKFRIIIIFLVFYTLYYKNYFYKDIKFYSMYQIKFIFIYFIITNIIILF